MYFVRATLLLCTLFTSFMTWAVDLQPNDIVAPLPNKNYVTVSYLNTGNSTLYKNGAAQAGNPVIDTQSAIFRGPEHTILAACQQSALFKYLTDPSNLRVH